MADTTTKVVFSQDFTTADGKARKGGQEYAIEQNEARDLVHRGLAQLAAKETPLPTAATPVQTEPKGGK